MPMVCSLQDSLMKSIIKEVPFYASYTVSFDMFLKYARFSTAMTICKLRNNSYYKTKTFLEISSHIAFQNDFEAR